MRDVARSRPRLVGLAALAATASAHLACGAPESFDGITGGVDAGGVLDAGPITLVDDPALPPARLVGPLASSWIDGSRPRFRVELASTALAGARIEVCRRRDCTGEKKVFDAPGGEVVAPEDLAPGLWYWRAVATTTSTVGTTKPEAMTWSLVMRGGARAGAVPAGSFVDLNGDGRADLIVALRFTEAGAAGTVDQALFGLLGASDEDEAALVVEGGSSPPQGLFFEGDPSLAASDVDGDGRSDLTFSYVPAAPRTPFLVFAPGSPTAPDGFDPDAVTSSIRVAPLDTPPNLAAVGDLDGDGHGDLAVGTRLAISAVFGSPRGPSVVHFMDVLDPAAPPDAGERVPPAASHAVLGGGGFDRDGDGLADLAAAHVDGRVEPGEEIPFLVASGAASRDLRYGALRLKSPPAPTLPSAFASGDLDGDGKSDLAFVTTTGGRPAVCVARGADPLSAIELVCWAPETAPAGFGASLVAADLEGDGRDELLVAGSGGFDILTLAANGTLAAEHRTSDFGVRLTALTPGLDRRPAVWAATRADGSQIALFRGREQVRVYAPPFGAKAFGNAIR